MKFRDAYFFIFLFSEGTTSVNALLGIRYKKTNSKPILVSRHVFVTDVEKYREGRRSQRVRILIVGEKQKIVAISKSKPFIIL